MPVYSSLLTALGWSLLDSIWQMAALWVAYGILTVGHKRFTASVKHNLALAMVLIGSVWFMYSFFHLLSEPRSYFIPGFLVISRSVEQWIPYLSILYMLILVIRSSQYGIQYYRHGKNISGRSVSGVLQSFTDRSAGDLGISRQVSVYLSQRATTAETSGFLKPFILLPVSLVTRLSPVQLEAILVHELFHIRRHDYLVNIFMTCHRAIFFFNPFAGLFFKIVAKEREIACDSGVIEMNYQPAVYAEALYSLEKFRYVQPGFSVAADGNRPWLLMDRICRILGKPVVRTKNIGILFIFNMLAAIALFGMQVKNFNNHPGAGAAPAPLAVVPARYAVEREKTEIINREVTKPVGNDKHGIKKLVAPLMLVIVNDTELTVEPKPLEEVYFTQNRMVRNFFKYSPEMVSDTSSEPSENLSYQHMPDIASDSISDNLAENDLLALIAQSHVEIANTLKHLEVDMRLKRHYLKEMEMKNRHLLYLNQKGIQPLLDTIHEQINLKKLQIDQLQIQLQVSDEEIIHI